MSARRPPWSEFRAALESVGFRPSRRLGQNFLLDGNLARAIARASGARPGEFVLEVGAGCGFLSVHLAEAGARLLAVEIDPRLFEVARRFLAGRPEVELLLSDVLESKHRLAAAVEARLPDRGPWHLCSNLPYAVGGPLLALLAARAHPPDSMVVLVQREVGERLTAEPGEREWGPLSIAIQSAYRARAVRSVGPQLFWPRPRVESCVVRMDRRGELASIAERARLRELVGALLGRRRQGLTRVLGERLGDRDAARDLLRDLGLDGARRAETLSMEELWSLLAALPSSPDPP